MGSKSSSLRWRGKRKRTVEEGEGGREAPLKALEGFLLARTATLSRVQLGQRQIAFTIAQCVSGAPDSSHRGAPDVRLTSDTPALPASEDCLKGV